MDARSDAEVIAGSLVSPVSFGELFDRHATTMFRYFVRRVGPDDADSLLGELFRIAFEKRAGIDPARAEARPWLYGIASNLLARHRQGEARGLDATGRLVNRSVSAPDLFIEVDARLDASRLWADIAAAIATLPQGERDAAPEYLTRVFQFTERRVEPDGHRLARSPHGQRRRRRDARLTRIR